MAGLAAGCGRRRIRIRTCSRSGPIRSSGRSCTTVCCRRSPRSGRAGPGGTWTFEESYNGSGAQARAIASGFDADVAILSHEGDMEVLVKAGRVKPAGTRGPTKGMITHSLVVIGHRDGQSQGHQGLGRPGEAGGGRAVSRSQDVGRGALEHQRHLWVGVPGLARGQEGRARSRRGPRLPGEGAGQRGQHGPVGPAEHGQLRRAGDGRRRRHLRERAAAPQQGEAPRSPT